MSNYKTTLQSNNTALNSNNLDLQSLIDQANALPDAGGIELPELTNEGSAADLLSGKQLIDGEGNVVTGTIVTKTEADLTVNGANVYVPAGYYASQTSKRVNLADPAKLSISVDNSGLISVTGEQSSGYISDGPISASKQLTTQSAKTVTPANYSQTAVASGVYTTGAVTVAAIPSQYITTTDATASADEIMSGETAYVNGSKVTGTFSIDSELNIQDDLIAQIQNAVDNLPEVGSGGSGGIETYTGTIVADSKYVEAYILYTDKNLTLQEASFGLGMPASITIEVPKNTAIIIDAPGGASADSGCEDIIGSGYSYHITANNFVITVN